ncbi:MAG: hypothetical protein JW811_06965 [Clostridiales bacterium]|nr:hypothetical protein [Clostridiales bacterium]
MTKLKRLNTIWAVLAFLGLAYSLTAYLIVQPQLVPSLAEPTAVIKLLGNLTIPALFVVGLYHLYLLMHAFRTLPGRHHGYFWHSCYVVFIALSGLFLISDLTLLSDIGKEYRLFSVREQWWMLYGFTGVHVAVCLAGALYSRKTPEQDRRLFDAIRSGNDAVFITLHHIGLLCGLMGIICAIVSFPDWIVTQRYSDPWMILLTCIALFPLALIVLYWVINNRKNPASAWLDEKQISDTAVASLAGFTAMLLSLPLCGALVWAGVTSLSAIRWFGLLFFIGLTVFCGAVIWRNRTAE